MKLDRSFLFVLSFFLLSGFAALLYQTAWMREFSFVFGTSELAIATVLAAYMGGLSLGAAIAGRLAHRVSRPVLVYGLLEGGIGLSALMIPKAIAASTFLSALLFGQADGPPASSGLGLALFYVSCSFLILLVPTAMMGATLPLLTRYAVRRDEELGRRVGALYAINTLGAILGTLVAGFVLLPRLGLSQTLLVGVVTNFIVFALAAVLARSHPRLPRQESVAERSKARAWIRADRILPLILLSGVTSFAYEVLWTRLFNQVLGGTVYAFSTMLASFLTGLTLGSALAARFATTRERAVIGFACSQLAIAVSVLLAFACMDQIPAWIALWKGPVISGVHLGDIGLAMLLLLPSTLAIGATFPFAVRITARGEEDAGPASARVYAWNTIGAILGALGAGYYVIPAFGFATSMALFAGTNLLLALLAAALLSETWHKGLLMASVLCGLVFWVVPPQTPWQLLRFSSMNRAVLAGEITFSRVGRSANVLLRERDGAWFVTTNGLPEAGVRPANDVSGDLTNPWLSSLPSLARPDTEDLLVIGFGGGLVVQDVPRSVKHIDVIELEPAVIEANRFIASRRFLDPLADPRIRVIENDARGAMVLTEKRYDAIVSQPSHPWTAGASHLYTKEFFELSKAHLNPAGVFVQWIGLNFVDEELLRVLMATLQDVFPHVRVYRPPPYGAVLFIASEEPLPIEETAAQAIAASPQSFLRKGIQSVEEVAMSIALDEEGVRLFSENVAVSTDDQNILQTRSPRILSSPIKAKGADRLLAKFDPILRVKTDLDLVFLAQRSLDVRPMQSRLNALVQGAATEEDSELIIAQIEFATERRGQGLHRLETWIQNNPDQADRAREFRVLFLANELQRGRAKAWERVGRLKEPAQAVLEAWQASDEGAIQEFEVRLAEIQRRDVLYEDALRLRARWRVASGDPEKGAEAVDLLTAITAGNDGTTRDFLLKSRAALLAGDSPTALRCVGLSLQRNRTRSMESTALVRELEVLLREIPVSEAEASYVEELVDKLGRRLNR